MKSLLGACAALVLYASPSLAAPIMFDLNGLLQDGSTVTGSITIDTTLGVATAVDLKFSLPADLTFDVLDGQAQVSPEAYQIQVGLAEEYPDFNVVLPVSTLVGFTGGNICSDSDWVNCPAVSTLWYSPERTVRLRAGALSPAAVPEPAIVLLLSTAMVGIGVRRRRLRGPLSGHGIH